ncbi:hypothetical protein MMC26_003045 [Xylographa opegraphella]|nr:hypothetical protein [Xylographa opegraphella]
MALCEGLEDFSGRYHGCKPETVASATVATPMVVQPQIPQLAFRKMTSKHLGNTRIGEQVPFLRGLRVLEIKLLHALGLERLLSEQNAMFLPTLKQQDFIDLNNSVDIARSVGAGHNELANEVIEKPQDVDARRRTLISNGNRREFTQAIQRLEAVSAAEEVLPADSRPHAPSVKLDKPAFSALQQDFRTKQAPRNLHARLPPSPTSVTSDRLSPEELALNVELLQLHMLHRSSFATQVQWESSAKKYYSNRFEALAADHENMTGREMNLQEQINASAIIAWGSGSDNVSVGSKIRKLSRILNDVVDLSDPSGQYTCLLNSFEHWYNNAFKIRQLRARRDSIHFHTERTLEGIGDGWKAEADTLRSKLLAYQEELILLGEAHPKSDLTRCLDAVLGALTNMLEELDVIRAIETQFLSAEENWLRDSLGRIAADLSSGIFSPSKPGQRR